VLFGVEISELWSQIQRRNAHALTLKKLIFPFFMMVIVLCNTFYSSSDYIKGYINYRLGKIGLTEFVIHHTLMGPNNVIAQEIAAYIYQNTNPDDYIFSWTELAQIFYLSNRRSSVDVIWPFHVSSSGSTQRVFELNPVYIFLGPTFLNNGEIPFWLTSELEISYHLEKTFDQYNLYRIK
jgi:hypothetical protein